VPAHYERLRRLAVLLLGDRREGGGDRADVFLKAWEAELAQAPPRDGGAWLTRVAVRSAAPARNRALTGA
jgi:DNA-directed RNA polymerase specialized sigma24 family protein